MSARARERLSGIIMDASTRQFVKFWSWEPPQWSRSPVYDDVYVPGSTEPHSFWSHTEASVWQFSIHLIASIDKDDQGLPVFNKEKENFIHSLVLPDFGIEPGEISVVKPPNLARIKIKKLIDIIGTIRNPSFNYVGPFDIEAGYSYQIDCSFSLQQQRLPGAAQDSMTSVRRLLAYGQTEQ